MNGPGRARPLRPSSPGAYHAAVTHGAPEFPAPHRFESWLGALDRSAPCGTTGDPAACVLARFLEDAGHAGARVYARRAVLADGRSVPLPRWARDVVSATDALALPDGEGTAEDPTPVVVDRPVFPDDLADVRPF